MNQSAELVSIWLTIPFLYLSIFVLGHWLPFFSQFVKGHKSSLTWLGAGIFIGIAGQWFDNAWWGAAWGTRYAGAPVWVWLFDNGVYSNVPFRQTAGLVGVYCHARAIYEYLNEKEVGSGDNGIGEMHKHIKRAFFISTIITSALFLYVALTKA